MQIYVYLYLYLRSLLVVEGRIRSSECFQHMASDMKVIRPQKLCTNYPLVEFTPLPRRSPLSCLRKTQWDDVKEDVKCFGQS